LTSQPSFVWNDPFLLDDQLTEEERMIRDAAAPMPPTSWRRASRRPICEDDRS
jgi:hypothetical protein